MKPVLAVLVATSIGAFAEDPPSVPDLGRAYVTIPYAELRALWEAGQRKIEPAKEPDVAPVRSIVHRADIRLALGIGASTLAAEFDVEVLDDKWQTIPLLGGDVRLDKAEAGGRSVLWQDGYALLTKTPGKAPAGLQLTAGNLSLATPPLQLKLGSAAVKRLTVAGVPAGLQVRVNGHLGTVSKDGTTIFHLPGEAGSVSIDLAAPRIEAVSKPPAPSQWQTQAQVLVRFAEGRLHYRSRVFARADDGSGVEMQFALPANAGGLEVIGEDLAEWTHQRGEDGRRQLRLRWKTRDILDREITVGYTVSQSPLAEQWTLHAPALPEEKEARHLFAIVAAEGLELQGALLRTAVESRRLPDWMRSEIGSAAFVTAEAPSQLVLQPKWLPTVPTAEAIVTEARAQLRLVADGSTQTAMTYTIQHQAPLAWRIELPVNVELLSCTVAGKTAQPIQRAQGSIELTLPTPAKGATSVVFVYAARIKPLDPVSGELALELPRTTLFIERLEWALSLPALFEITAIDGNVSVSGEASTTGDVRSLTLRKDFCRAERPSVAVFYQRRGLEK